MYAVNSVSGPMFLFAFTFLRLAFWFILRRHQHVALKVWFNGLCVGKDLEGSTAKPFEILFRNFPCETERNHEKSVRITVVTAEIPTEHLQN
jgi:hypothetical protein